MLLSGKLYHNQTLSSNTPPTASTNLTNTFSSDGKTVTFSWSKPTDNLTLQDGLQYNLYVHISTGDQNIISSLADKSTGFRRVVRLGNSQSTSYGLTGLLPNQTYYWGVQAIDGGFMGSPFSNQQHFVTPCTSAPMLEPNALITT
ncbi:fibronectin type III domain-containing protein [Spirosoma endbachense]|uniref:fibronectin type III domain-containing protein n=1 Tax=Spirosoma endbachense TaxID=2666025 RepID=UPI003741FCFB